MEVQYAGMFQAPSRCEMAAVASGRRGRALLSVDVRPRYDDRVSTFI
jgi:hypothetical protein